MNNTQVAHAFVYGDNGQGSNFKSSNGTLWSYNSILAMRKDDRIFISHHIANYSNSSQKHASHLRSAIGYGTHADAKSIMVYGDIRDVSNELGITHEVDYATTQIKEYLIKQSNARSRSYFDYEIKGFIENTIKLLEYCPIDKRTAIYKEWLKYSDLDVLKEGYSELIASYKKTKDNEAKKEILRKHKARYKKIQDFTSMTNAEMKNYTKTELSNYDFLKIENDSVFTSAYSQVPLTLAKTLYRAMKRGNNVIGERINGLTHNKVSVKIGCHNVLIKELERVI